MTEVTREKSFVAFADFQQTVKVLSTNLINAILSSNIYAKGCFHSCHQKQTTEDFSTL